MSEQLQQFWQRFRDFPRAIQWAILAAIGIVVFVIWNDYVLTVGNNWSVADDRIERDVTRVRDSTAMDADFRAMRDTIIALGPVNVPAEEQAATDALNRVINDILNEYRNDISNQSFNRAAGDRLRKGSLVGIIKAGQIGRKLTGELEFDSSPETATAILSRLESSADIEAVTEVRITKIEGRKVGMKLKLEAWVVVKDTSRRS